MNLIDSNIIAYAYDDSEPKKRDRCLEIIRGVFNNQREGYVTNQILGELFYTLTKNFRQPVSIENAQLIVSSIIKSESWKKINYNCETVDKAIDLIKKFNVPFWDALIAATMIENNVFSIYTENVNHFKRVTMLKAINPLSN